MTALKSVAHSRILDSIGKSVLSNSSKGAPEPNDPVARKIVKASLLALSDPDLRDSNTLHTIYALAIKHRLDPSSMDDIDETETVPTEAPTKSKRSSKRSVGDQVSST